MANSGDIAVRVLRAEDAQALLDYAVRNREYLTPFEPARNADYLTLERHQERIADEARIEFVAVAGDLIVGQVAISNISRAPVYLNCTIGYSVDEHHQGRGVASTLVQHAVRHAFGVEHLHRVEAGTLLDNAASRRVLERCGFTQIGISPRHVKIAGRWQDHMLYAITREDLE